MNHTPLRSMTGFGEAEADAGKMRLRVEIRTVNQRHLKIQLRTPAGHERHQPRIERVLRAHFARGQVTATLTAERTADAPAEPAIRFDAERARAVSEGLRTLTAELGLDDTIDLALLSRFRGVVEEDSANADPELPEGVLGEVVAEAALRAVAAREEEGAFLREDLEARLDAMDAGISRVEARAPERLTREHDRLRRSVAALIGRRGDIDEDRIAREIAHLADRWDVHEEIVRFRSHLQLFRATLAAGNPSGIGKRLGFVSQELLREANTIGAKANDAEIAESVVALKEEIEKVREQVENIE